MSEGGVLRTRVMSSTQHKPGHTWVVLTEEDGAFNVTLPLGFGRSQTQSNGARMPSYIPASTNQY